jgi:hypothetical protein
MTNNMNGSQRFLLPYRQWLGSTRGNQSTKKDLPSQEEVQQAFDDWFQEYNNSGVSREHPGPSRLTMSKTYRRPTIERPLTQAQMKRFLSRKRYQAAANMVSITAARST